MRPSESSGRHISDPLRFSVASSLRAIQKGLLKLHRSGIRKSKLWLIAFCIFTGLGALSAAHLNVLLSIDDLIDPDFRTYLDLRHLNSAFADKNDLFLVVSAKDRALDRNELCAIQKWLIDDVNGQEPYHKVFSAFGAKKALELDQNWSVRSVLDPQCEKMNPTSDIAAQLRELRESPWGASLTSHDAHDVAISFYLNDGLKRTRYGPFDVEAVAHVLKSFKAAVTDRFTDLQGHFAGVAFHQYYLKQGLDQTTLLNLGLPLLVFLIFWIFFGDLRPGFLFAVTITIASLIVYGLMALLRCPLDILTNILTLMLVLSSLEDYLFILHFNLSKKPRSWRTAFRRLLMPGFFTSVTTAIGFASLCVSDLAIVRRFGAFSCIAALLEWVLVFIFVPALLQRFATLRSWLQPNPAARLKLGAFFEQAARVRLPRAACMALLGFYAASAYGLFHLHISDAPASIFPKTHVLSRDLDFIQKSRGWESQVSLVFDDFNQGGANRALLTQIRDEPNVVTIESPYDVEDYLTRDLKPNHASLMRDAWRDSPAAARLIATDGSARALIYLKKTDTASIDRLQQIATQLCATPTGPHCHLAGTLVSYAEFGDRVLSTLLESLCVSLLLVSLMIVYLLKARGHTHYTATLISAMWGPCTLIAVFWVFQFPLTYITCTFASIVVGLAGDNTIQYLFASPRGTHLTKGLHQQGSASIQISAIMMLLALIFLASYFASVRSLTPLFVLGFFLTLVGDLWLYKFLVTD